MRWNKFHFAISLLFSMLVWWNSYQYLGITDLLSERQAVNDAIQISKGNHRYGIVLYSHYPNGPSYLLLPLIKFGVSDWNTLRLLPLTLSSLALGFFLYAMLCQVTSFFSGILLIFSCVMLAFQPGIQNWNGGLHEFAYSLALVFVLIAIAMIPQLRRLWYVFAGFIAGWLGYDFLPATIFAFFTARLLKTASFEELRLSLQRCVVDSGALVSGIIWAIFLHLIQDIMFYRNVREGLDSVLGTAAVRAGLSNANLLNPKYYEFIHSRLPNLWKDPSRFALIRAYTATFFQNVKWTEYPYSALFMTGTIGLFVIEIRRRTQNIRKLDAWIVALIGILGVFLADFMWIVLMPYHATFHFHIVPRHFFAGCALVLVFPLLMFRKDNVSVPASNTKTEFAYYAAFLLFPSIIMASLMIMEMRHWLT